MIFAKINPKTILKAHWRTLHRAQSSKTSIKDVILFYGLPLGAAIALVGLWEVTIVSEALGVLVTALSILAGLLFNMLILVFRMAKEPERFTFENLQAKIVREVYSNIAYAVIVALVALLALIVYPFVPEAESGVLKALSGFAFFLIANFVLTIFMVLKRMHVLLEEHVQTG